MITKLIGVMAGVLLWTNICLAQTTNPQSLTNWGESVCDVQLSIGLTNNVTAAGSLLNLRCRIKNSSTNFIFWPVINLTQGFVVSLTNKLGRVYELIPDRTTNMMPITYNMSRKVLAGEVYECLIPITMSNDIDSGTYELVARKHFFTADKKVHELVSNLLHLQIKQFLKSG